MSQKCHIVFLRTFFCSLILCTSFITPSAGQMMRPMANTSKIPVQDLESTFSAMMPRGKNYVLKVNLPSGEIWQCLVTPQSQVVARGTASKDLLKKGTYISVTGTLKLKNATFEEPVSEVTIFSPSKQALNRKPGVYPSWNAPKLYVSPQEMMGNHFLRPGGAQPGNDINSGPNILQQDDEENGKKPKIPETVDVTVRGMITNIQKSGTVTLGVRHPLIKGSVKIKLEEDVTVNAILGGSQALMFLREGDTITLTGTQSNAGMKSMEAQFVDIQYAATLEPLGKKKKTSSKKEDSDDEDKTETESQDAKPSKKSQKK
ncbi:MAG: hypothetical protein Q4C96_10130 [Planctomycetia bacterium]|nr:hypothetical protein [Planctomycetia bacterium]